MRSGTLLRISGTAIAVMLAAVSTLMAGLGVLVLDAWYLKLFVAGMATLLWFGARAWYLGRWAHAAWYLLLGSPSTLFLGIAGPLLVVPLVAIATLKATNAHPMTEVRAFYERHVPHRRVPMMPQRHDGRDDPLDAWRAAS